MSLKLNVKNLDKVINLFDSVKSNIKPDVIDKGLDATLTKDLAKLKERLLNSVNNELKTKVAVQDEKGGVEEITIKKSDQEVVKHLTGVDLEKVTKTRDFNTLADGKIAMVTNRTLQKVQIDNMTGSPTSRMSSGVNLRLPMSPADTFENQYAQAVSYYNNAIFAIVDNSGKVNYYQNPGIDMTQYVKVVCSNKPGDTERSRQVFDRYKDGTRPGGRESSGKIQDFADWTLLKDGLDKVKSSFINVTDVIDKVKEGEHSEAKAVLEKVSQRATASNNLAEKVDDLKDNKKLDPSVQSYNNIVKLLKNLKLEKSVKKDRTFYTLVSQYDENVEDYEKFQERLIREVRLWKIENEQSWVQELLKSIRKLVEKSLR